MAERELNWNSRQVTHGWQWAMRSFFWGLGFEEEDFDKPQIGIGVPLLEGNICNVHAYELASLIREGCQEAGLLGFPFGTPAISDNLTQALEGGNASLPSRNLIANCAEMVTSGHSYDAMVGLHHCDKNGPGFAMALARMNYPGLIVSGGTILPGCYEGEEITSATPYEAQSLVAMGRMDRAEGEEIVKHACPGPGGCGIAASFNTWGVAMEAIGLMLPDSSSNPAVSGSKREECRRVGLAVRNLLESGIRPRDVLTRKSFENAVAAVAAIGGSTNGILHLLALAREAEVDFSLCDIQPILRRTPVLCNFAPRGTKTMAELHKLGGTAMLLRHLLEAGILDGDCLTVTGCSLADSCADAPAVCEGQDLISPADQPFKERADMQVCFGNLAPGGIVFKVSSMQESLFRGTAMCFDETRAVVDAAREGRIRPGTVVILRYLGPLASGMPEVLMASSILNDPALYGKVALISDSRVSGISHGAIGVHCAPEAAAGGPIALVDDGDTISFDLKTGEIMLEIGEDELRQRRAQWTPREFRHARRYLSDFAATVTQADQGCVSRS
ncbi:MAG: dihydroxy-acid dehydratase [Roseibacillus sp.]|nr:dihydroxy-acid dehydratase [Roseibacillus sp.]